MTATKTDNLLADPREPADNDVDDVLADLANLSDDDDEFGEEQRVRDARHAELRRKFVSRTQGKKIPEALAKLREVADLMMMEQAGPAGECLDYIEEMIKISSLVRSDVELLLWSTEDDGGWANHFDDDYRRSVTIYFPGVVRRACGADGIEVSIGDILRWYLEKEDDAVIREVLRLGYDDPKQEEAAYVFDTNAVFPIEEAARAHARLELALAKRTADRTEVEESAYDYQEDPRETRHREMVAPFKRELDQARTDRWEGWKRFALELEAGKLDAQQEAKQRAFLETLQKAYVQKLTAWEQALDRPYDEILLAAESPAAA